MTERTPPDGSNRLAFEKSPYLIQHARNPVDWYPWGAEAFERAKREDKPIFLSIGYSTCHWCHVMEHESFENEGIARLLSAEFVSIKVDREERPDVDDAYMEAVIAMTGSGGWPMSVFLDHELRPFFGGTYFPPDDRYGRPGFPSLLRQLATLWRNDRAKLLEASAELERHLRVDLPSATGAPELIDDAVLELALAQWERRFDAVRGGFGHAPKFPPHLALDFLLRRSARKADDRAERILRRTLDAMASRGLFDQLGGGFHRYSTDAEWIVPHFEKMLYDNAMLAKVYLRASQAFGVPFWDRIGRETLDWMLREMVGPEGAFWSAQDADSADGEGSFYVFTPGELDRILGAEAELAALHWGITEAGNFVVERHGESGRPGSIPTLAMSVPQLAERTGRSEDDVAASLVRARAALLSARRLRPAPSTDDKVLVDWNGLAISAFAVGFEVTGETRFLDVARRAADFLLDTLVRDGALLHRYRDGEAAIDGFLPDYAFFVEGLLDLYEASLDPKYFRAAVDLNDRMLALFHDRERRLLYMTATSGEIGRRLLEDQDGAIPSGPSVAVMNLRRVSEMTSREDLAELADGIEGAAAGIWRVQPTALAALLSAAELRLSKPSAVVLGGAEDSAGIERMHRVLFSEWWPAKVVLRASTADGLESLAPLVAGRERAERATAFVCRDRSCSLPTTDPEAMRKALRSG